MDNDDDENGNEEIAGGEGDVSVEPFETVQEDDEEDDMEEGELEAPLLFRLQLRVSFRRL